MVKRKTRKTKMTYGEMHKICQPAGGSQDYITMKAGRKLSMPLTVLFIKLGISANSVSFARWFVGLLGVLLIACGGYPLTIAGVLIFHLAIVLDYVDGELFRWYTWETGRKSTILQGSWLDKVFDNSYRPMLLLAAGCGAWRQFGNPWFLVLGGVGAVLIMFDILIKLRTSDVLIYKKGVHLLEREKASRQTKGGSAKDMFMELWRINNPVTFYWWFAIVGYLWLFLCIFVPLLALQVGRTFWAQWRKILKYDSELLKEARLS